MRKRWLVAILLTAAFGVAAATYWRPTQAARAIKVPGDAAVPSDTAAPKGSHDIPRRSVPATGLFVEVTTPTPDSFSGRVAVAIVAETGIVRFERVPLNGGPYDVASLPPGHYFVAVCDNLSGQAPRALHDLSWPAPVDVDVAEEGPGTQVALAFGKQRRGRLEIAVYNDRGEPAPDVTLEIGYANSVRNVVIPLSFEVTNLAGRVRSPFLPEGNYSISVYRLSAELLCNVPERQVVALEADSDRLVEIRLSAAGVGTLRGQVVGTGVPTGHQVVTVYVDGENSSKPLKSLQTNEEGQFVASLVPAGRYHVVVWPEDCLESVVDVTIAAGRETYAVVPAEVGGVTVFGRLMEQNGSRVAKARVNVNARLQEGRVPRGRPRQTDETGLFEAGGLSPGEYLVILWDYGLVRAFSIAPTEKGPRVEIECPRILETPQGWTLAGRVTDEVEDAVGYAFICLREVGAPPDTWTRFVESDPQGQFRFSGVPPGAYEIWHEPAAMAHGFAVLAPLIVQVGEADSHIDILLRRR